MDVCSYTCSLWSRNELHTDVFLFLWDATDLKFEICRCRFCTLHSHVTDVAHPSPNIIYRVSALMRHQSCCHPRLASEDRLVISVLRLEAPRSGNFLLR